MSRKHSPRAVLKKLDDDIQARLYDYLKAASLADGVKYCREELKVATNDTSLSEWRSWFEMMQRINRYSAGADDLKAELSARNVDPDLVAKLGEQYFMSKAAEDGDVKAYAAVASIVQRHNELKAQQQAHADKMAVAEKQINVRRESVRLLQRRVDAAERKVAALEQKNALALEKASKAKGLLAGGDISDEARTQLMQTMDEMILGIKPAKAKPAGVKE